MNNVPPNHLCCVMLALLATPLGVAAARSGDPPDRDATAAAKYSDEVVAKADAILDRAGLRRTGDSWHGTATPELARRLTVLTRERRELQKQQNDLKASMDGRAAIVQQLGSLRQQDTNLNLQLARIASGDVTTNNKLVALINATRAQTTAVMEQGVALEKMIEQQRGVLNQAETAYAQNVFDAREALDAAIAGVETALQAKETLIAVKVAHVNFGCPDSVTGAAVYQPIQKRLAPFEQEVFRESISLERQSNGSLTLNVSINGQPIRMVLDSGASLVVLPTSALAGLNITVPADAEVRRVLLANGGEIQARIMTLPSVRVGQFMAKDVEAVILGAEATNAEPLLGLSFLGRFKFEIDQSQRSLRMLRVGGT